MFENTTFNMLILAAMSPVEMFPTFIPNHLSNFSSHWFLKPSSIPAQLHLSALPIVCSVQET